MNVEFHPAALREVEEAQGWYQERSLFAASAFLSVFGLIVRMSNCVFCDIVAGRSEVSIVYRDSQCMAFMDTCPINTGHVLVVPLNHATGLAELEPGAGGALFQAAQQIAAAIRHSTLNPDGINLLLADGEAAGQEVFHVHLHVLPRYRRDGFGHKFPPQYGRRPVREELDDVAAAIRTSLAAA